MLVVRYCSNSVFVWWRCDTRYLLPVLRMASYLYIMARNGRRNSESVGSSSNLLPWHVLKLTHQGKHRTDGGVCSSVFTCIGALGTPPPTERGPSLESIYRVFLTVDLCEGNKIISFKKIISPQPVRGPSKRKKNPGALGTCPVCPLVKTALGV